jgi:hypothetical protein
MSTAQELVEQEAEKKKKINPAKWRNRFMFGAFGILGFLIVSISSIFFPDSWAITIKNIVQIWGVPAIVLYGAPALAFLFGARAKEEPDATLSAIARVFWSLTVMAVIMSIFSYILATGMVGTAGAWLWGNPLFIMMSGWLFFFDFVFFLFLSWELMPKQWSWIFRKFGYETHPPPPREDRIFHKMRIYLSYEYEQTLKELLARGDPDAVPVESVLPDVFPAESDAVHTFTDDDLAVLRQADEIIAKSREEGGGESG